MRVNFLFLLFVFCIPNVLYANEYYVTNSNVNFRDKPNLNSNIINVIPKDTFINNIKVYNEKWYEIEFKNINGYIYKNLVSIIENFKSNCKTIVYLSNEINFCHLNNEWSLQ